MNEYKLLLVPGDGRSVGEAGSGSVPASDLYKGPGQAQKPPKIVENLWKGLLFGPFPPIPPARERL